MTDPPLNPDSILQCYVHPKASRLKHQFNGLEGEVWLPAAPEGGRANRLLVEYLAKLLDVSSSRIILLQGLKSRNKRILVKGLNTSEVISILSSTGK